MAEVLKTFIEGEDILASETNANNQYLLGRISDNAERLQNFVDGEITSIQSNISSVQATLQNSINEMSDKLNAELGSMYDNIAPNYSAGISVSTGWSATSSGWISAVLNSSASGTNTLTIDGQAVLANLQGAGDGRAGYLGIRFMVYIAKGQVVGGSHSGLVFYPCKGVQNA